MEHHAYRCQCAGEDAHIEGNRIDDPVNKRMKSNPKHWDDTNRKVNTATVVTNKCIKEAVERIE